MKVLVLVDHAVGISGPHRNVVSSLNALSARSDIDLRLLTGKIDDTEPYAGRCDIRLGFNPHDPQRAVSNLRVLRAALQGRDLIYVPTGLKSFLYAFAAKGRRKLVAGPNVSNLPLPGRRDHPGYIELRLMADVWLEASEFRKKHVLAHTAANNVICVHHAIDTHKFSPDKANGALWQQLGIPSESIKVLYVGKDYFLKGVDVLIGAIEVINQLTAAPSPVDFVFAGHLTEANRQRLLKIPNAHALGFLTGETLCEVYASSQLSVVPSSYENFPFTVLEAMASGLPVIASQVGGIPEQIVHEQSGILINISSEVKYFPHAQQLLAEAILHLTAQAEKRQKLGAEARARVLANFSEARLGQNLYDIFWDTLK